MKSLVIPFVTSFIFLPIFALAQTDDIMLPKPSFAGKKSVEEAIKSRRTIRHFKAKALNLKQLSQLLWAAYGITAEKGPYKSAPSAGALYPLDIWVAVGEKAVEGAEAGVYHYLPPGHKLTRVRTGEVRDDIARAALNQSWMAEAPIILVITGEYERCTRKYRERGIIYTYVEAGHVGQNIFLQAEALGLGVGIVGAFYNNLVQQVLGIGKVYDPILIMPAGYK